MPPTPAAQAAPTRLCDCARETVCVPDTRLDAARAQIEAVLDGYEPHDRLRIRHVLNVFCSLVRGQAHPATMEPPRR